MVIIRLSAIVLLFSSGLVSAAPTAHVDEFPNMVVLIRNSVEEGFAHSPAVADKVKAEIRSGVRSIESPNEERSIAPTSSHIDPAREVLDRLEKRSTISLQYCKNTTCTAGCQTTTSTFEANFCLNVPGTQCIIIMNLTNAKIRYWNHEGCNGNESTYKGCGNTGGLSAPGTNSIGFQLNCN